MSTSASAPRPTIHGQETVDFFVCCPLSLFSGPANGTSGSSRSMISCGGVGVVCSCCPSLPPGVVVCSLAGGVVVWVYSSGVVFGVVVFEGVAFGVVCARSSSFVDGVVVCVVTTGVYTNVNSLSAALLDSVRTKLYACGW